MSVECMPIIEMKVTSYFGLVEECQTNEFAILVIILLFIFAGLCDILMKK